MRPMKCGLTAKLVPGFVPDRMTNFERKYRIEGRPIYRAYYRFDD